MKRHRGPGKAQIWIAAHVAHTDDGCLPWPFSRNAAGYGVLGSAHASRAMCIAAYGPPPTNVHVAAHKCTDKACVNPRHLYWATPSENMMDKVRDGTSNRGTQSPFHKLTDEDVLAIRSAHQSGASMRGLGRQYGVSGEHVRAIVSGRKWSWL